MTSGKPTSIPIRILSHVVSSTGCDYMSLEIYWSPCPLLGGNGMQQPRGRPQTWLASSPSLSHLKGAQLIPEHQCSDCPLLWALSKSTKALHPRHSCLKISRSPFAAGQHISFLDSFNTMIERISVSYISKKNDSFNLHINFFIIRES